MKIETKYNVGDKVWTEVVVLVNIGESAKCSMCGHDPLHSPTMRSKKITQCVIKQINFMSKMFEEKTDPYKASWEDFVQNTYKEDSDSEDRIFYSLGPLEKGVSILISTKLERELFLTKEEAEKHFGINK